MLGSGGWQDAPTHSPPAGSVTRTGWEWFPHALFGIPIILSTLSDGWMFIFLTQSEDKRTHNSMCGGSLSFL